MSTFGNTDERTSNSLPIIGKIGLTKFTYSGATKQAKTLHLYINNWREGHLTGLIYDGSFNLVGQTKQGYVTGYGDIHRWVTLTFYGTRPEVSNGIYYLGAWSDSVDIRIGSVWADVGTSEAMTIAYDEETPPDPFIADETATYADASVYVTLEALSAAVPDPSPTPEESDKWLALGDSITDGSGKNPPYPEYLGELTTMPTTNGGYTGYGSGQLLSLWNSTYASGAFTFVSLLMGVNDVYGGVAAQTVKDNIEDIALSAIAEGAKAVYIFTLTPCGEYDGWTETMQSKVEDVNDWILNTASTLNPKIHAINIYATLEDTETPTYLADAYDSGDHLHPNQAFTDLMASELSDEYTSFMSEEETDIGSVALTAGYWLS